MNYREEHILKGLVEAYIATGKPVGSRQLVEGMKLQVSPATVRNIFRELEEEGLVVQPHTSAGRIPTDEGYRYYIRNLQFREATVRQREKLSGKFEELCASCGHPAKATAKTLASTANLLALSCWLGAGDVYEAGIAGFISSLTTEERDAVNQVARLIDDADQYILNGFERNKDSDMQVYVGEDNPMFPSRDLGMIIRSFEDKSGETVLLMLVGPKRMQYKENATLLNSMASILKTTV